MEHWQDSNTGQPKHLGSLWTLEKKGHRAVCVLRGHPVGCEAWLEVDGDYRRSAAFREGTEAVNSANEWRRQFEATGWAAHGRDDCVTGSVGRRASNPSPHQET